MGESKTMKRIRVLHSELNGELGGIESFLCKADKANKAKIIQSKFRNSMSAPCLRPLSYTELK